jgi:hypothetical protein
VVLPASFGAALHATTSFSFSMWIKPKTVGHITNLANGIPSPSLLSIVT